MRYLLLICLVLMSGCAAFNPFIVVPLGINTMVFWKNGQARKFYTGDRETISQNLKDSIASFGQHTDPEKDNKFVSHSQNHEFKWEVTQHDPSVTLVKCRVDFWGDKEYVELILRKLDDKMNVKTVKIVDESTDRRWRRKQ